MSFTPLPPDGFIDDLTSPAPAETGVAGAVAWFAGLRNFVAQLWGAAFEIISTLSGDAFVPTQAAHVVAAQTGTADDLKNLATSGIDDGFVVRLRPDTGDTITVKNSAGGSGQIVTSDGADLALSGQMRIWVSLDKTADLWREEYRSWGGNAAGLRTWLGLVIGTTVQAYSAILAALAGLTGAADKLPYFTGTTSMAVADFTAYARTLLALSSKAAVQAELGIGNVQVPVRQTTLSGPVTSTGLPNFGGSTGGTTVTATGTLVVTAANGFSLTAGGVDRVGSIVNPSWIGLNTGGDGQKYAYLDIAADGSCTPGFTMLAPDYQRGTTYSTTSGQFTFSIPEMVGKVGNGSSAVQTYRVFVGEFTVASGVVSQIKWYALRGEYDSGYTSTLAAAGTVLTYNANIGVPQVTSQIIIRCNATDLGFSVGDEVENVMFASQTDVVTVPSFRPTATTVKTTVGAVGNGWYTAHATTGVGTSLSRSKWDSKLVAKRKW